MQITKIKDWRQLVLAAPGTYMYKGDVILKYEDHYRVQKQIIMPLFGAQWLVTCVCLTAFEAMADIENSSLEPINWN